MKGSNISGIIYPLKQKDFDLLKKRDDPIYVKFTRHEKSNKELRLSKNDFLLFYISRKRKAIEGYGKITNVYFISPDKVINNYLNRIQMRKKYFETYISDRESKDLLAIEIESVIELNKPIKPNKPITMAGRYVTDKEIKKMGIS